jgi:thiol-disulfide isomerase/thioredoxin
MDMYKGIAIFATMVMTAAAAFSRSDDLARGHALWDQRLAKSAIAAFEAAASDKTAAAEAHEALGRIYTFKGWQQEGVFPGWHDETTCRARALSELKASLAADPTRASAQEALRIAQGFAAAVRVDPSPPRAEVKGLDAKLESFRTMPNAPIDDIVSAIEERAKAQADATPYFVGAQILIDRGEYDRAIALAERGAKASDRFIEENLSAYQMTGKSQGSYKRGRGTAYDLVGWALFSKKDYAGAAAKLEEAERLFQAQDFGNEVHLAELAKARDEEDRALQYFLNALSLSGGTPPLRQRATKAVTGIYTRAHDPAGFEAWQDAQLLQRREERRKNALQSMVDRPLPKLTLVTVDGRPFDATSLAGKVLLLDFFASWCGSCRAELPHLKAAFDKYKDDPGVAFLLVSLDEDAQRLQRYLNDLKFPFPVACAEIDQVQRLMRIDNVPWTFYVDGEGIVRYQTNGTEAHGDSLSRVSWYLDQIKSQR